MTTTTKWFYIFPFKKSKFDWVGERGLETKGLAEKVCFQVWKCYAEAQQRAKTNLEE